MEVANRALAFIIGAAILSDLCLAIRKSSEIPKNFLGNKNCRVIISEINVFPAGSDQFIELMRVCYPDPSNVFKLVTSKKYKLAFVDHSGFLIGVCELKNEGYRRTGKFIYYTIGGVRVPNTDMKISECSFAEDHEGYYPGIIPDGGKYPIAVMLVYHPKGSLSWLELQNDGYRKLKVPLAADLERKLVPLIVDMYIYTTKSPYTACDYFETFYDGYKRPEQLILRDWVSSDIGRTLSRCNPEDVSEERQWDPMNPKSFLLAKPTPGDLNDCNTGVFFRIEDMQERREPPIVHFKTTPEYSCYITTVDLAIDMFNLITNPVTYTSKIAEIIQAAQEPDDENIESLDAEDDRLPIPIEKFEEKLAKSSPHIWPDCKRFEFTAWIASLRNSKVPIVSPEHILSPDVCNWLDYVLEGFRCKLCSALWIQQIIFERPGSPQVIAVKSSRSFRAATSASTKYNNKALIDKHQKTQLHQISLDYFTLFDAGKRGSELQEEFYRENGPMQNFLQPTVNEFIAVYQATRMNIPFFKFIIMVETLNFFKINIGHLYQNPGGARLITMSISSTLHRNFTTDLLARKPEMSVLIDTSTDVSSTAAVVIMFQTFDITGKVVVKVYRILEAGKRETGDSLFEIFEKALENDGLKDYVQEKCVGFASDGGSNVRKFRRLLEEKTSRTLMTVHCYAHKLDLVLVHSWEENENLQEIDAVVNALYRIFNSKSHKKKEMLKTAAKQCADKEFELKRIVPTRWINSKRRAIATVLVHWKTIVRALEAVLADIGTTKTQISEAKAVLNALKDPSVVTTMAFVTDACDELAALSLELQVRGTTLIGKRERRQRLISKLTEMKTIDGPRLRSVIEKAVLVENDQKVESLEDFETKKITLDGIDMDFHPQAEDERLISQRNHYIRTVIDEIEWYFPNDAADNVDIFDPRRWANSEIEHFGNTEILDANRGLRWNFPPAEILQDWVDTKERIYNHVEFVKWTKKTPEEFWIHYLNEGSGVTIPGRIKTVVTNLLVIPATTAEVERVFSVYTNTKIRQRYNLNVETVEAIVRIKSNGPKHLDEFDSPDFVRKFILSGHSRSNDETRGTRKRKHVGDSGSESDVTSDGSSESTGDGMNSVSESESPAYEVARVSEEEQLYRQIIYDSDEVALGASELVIGDVDDDGEDY